MLPALTKKLPKHHYIPVFYLKQWVGSDGRLCEFSRPYKIVVPRRTSPDGTGYVRGLYRLPNVPEEKAEIIETSYMRSVDNGAAPALRVMLNPKSGPPDLTGKLKAYWARFLHCLILRNPEYLAAISEILKRGALGSVEEHRAEYEKLRKPTDPLTFDEFKAKFLANPLNTSGARIIHKIADSESVINHIAGMRWHILEFSNSPHLLMTSDRPIIMTNGMSRPGAHMGMPISPTQLFLACHDQQAFDQLRAMPVKELIRVVNTKVVEQARKYVYAFSDADLRFVSKGLGKQIPASPLETGVLRLAAA